MVHTVVVLDHVCSLGTAFETHATTDATSGKYLQLWPGLERLGVVTPKAAQVAALEKDRRPDARTVVDGKTLNVGNDSREARSFWTDRVYLCLSIALLHFTLS
jgi:hypothetical protein